MNWVKGQQKGSKTLFRQTGDNRNSPWEIVELPKIGPSLSFEVDVSAAGPIKANASSTACFQGQTHGHEGFLLDFEEAQSMIAHDKGAKPVLYPFMITDDLIGTKDSLPSRFVIDFSSRDLLEARKSSALFKRVEQLVLPDRRKAAKEEEERNKEAAADDPKAKLNHHHANFLRRWWQLSYARADMLQAISVLPRYIVCGRVTKRPIFEFVSPEIRPNDSLSVFPLDDDYSFGILQSGIHWRWFIERCSTLKSDPRYTSNTVFDSFPWPQAPTLKAVEKVATAAVQLRKLRRELMDKHELSLRELYRTLELPGASPLKSAQDALDQAVRKAFGMNKSEDPLPFLLELNQSVVNAEAAGELVTGPGIPSTVKNRKKFVSDDCISMPVSTEAEPCCATSAVEGAA